MGQNRAFRQGGLDFQQGGIDFRQGGLDFQQGGFDFLHVENHKFSVKRGATADSFPTWHLERKSNSCYLFILCLLKAGKKNKKGSKSTGGETALPVAAAANSLSPEQIENLRKTMELINLQSGTAR